MHTLTQFRQSAQAPERQHHGIRKLLAHRTLIDTPCAKMLASEQTRAIRMDQGWSVWIQVGRRINEHQLDTFWSGIRAAFLRLCWHYEAGNVTPEPGM